jgi:hypothetical protein
MMAISVTLNSDENNDTEEHFERKSQQTLAHELCRKIWKHVLLVAIVIVLEEQLSNGFGILSSR